MIDVSKRVFCRSRRLGTRARCEGDDNPRDKPQLHRAISVQRQQQDATLRRHERSNVRRFASSA